MYTYMFVVVRVCRLTRLFDLSRLMRNMSKKVIIKQKNPWL